MNQCVHEPLFVIGGELSNFSFKMYTNQMDSNSNSNSNHNNNHHNNNHHHNYHHEGVGQYSHTSSSVSDSLLSNLLSELDLKTALAIVGVIWAVIVWLVSCLGNIVVRHKIIPSFTTSTCGGRASAVSKTLEKPIGVSVIRPIKSPSATTCEPQLADCLLSVIRQKYPLLQIILTVSSSTDPAVPVIEKLVKENPDVDITVIIGEENVGINPKVNNMVRGWRETKHDIIWIIDANVWVDSGALARAVDVLTGQPYVDSYGRTRQRTPSKFVHHLPVCIEVTDADSTATAVGEPQPRWRDTFGTRLEEMFLSSSHAKFYTAINTVCIAPCIVGKSNMFRKSHLMECCPPTPYSSPPNPEGGIRTFAQFMCEDHLIGEKLWHAHLEDEKAYGGRFLKHTILNEIAYQPMGKLSITEYWNRRTRWLRVRKYTVLAATLVEPGTECFVCSIISTLSFAYLGLLPAWLSPILFFMLQVLVWMWIDFSLYNKLHAYEAVNVEQDTPYWIARGTMRGKRGVRINRRTKPEWFAQWFGREALAFPIWFASMVSGDVNWRGTSITVGIDGIRASE